MKTHIIIFVCLLSIEQIFSQITLWGMTSTGGNNDAGVIFKFDTTTLEYTKQLDFDVNNNGDNPSGELTQAPNGKLYGVTQLGGQNNMGVLFEYNPNLLQYTKILDFNGILGQIPYRGLTLANNGKLYGFTHKGGTNDVGVLYELDPNSLDYNIILNFDGISNGANPFGKIIQDLNGILYGLTLKGGNDNLGVLFSYNLIENTYEKLIDFNGTNGSYPRGSLIQASNNKLYGVTELGGENDFGTIFQFDIETLSFVKRDFDNNTNGRRPVGDLVEAPNKKLYGMTQYGGVNDNGVLFSFNIETLFLNKIIDFNSSNGANPSGSLYLASNNLLYGMTRFGGNNNRGTLFEFDTENNTLVKKLNFENTIGTYPDGGLYELEETLNINDIELNNNITIFPNPTPKTINIHFDQFQEKIHLSFFSFKGKLLKSEMFKNTDTIQLNINFPKGMYFIKIYDTHYNLTVQKIIVK